MMRALLTVRFRAILAAFTAQTRQKKKKSKGMMILFAVLYVYVAVVIAGAMCMLFGQLAGPYHQAGLDWLYFAMAGLMGLAFSVFGGVFMTQNQLYDAKDNDLLLSMPIPSQCILMSRMIPLLGLDLVFCGIVMVPAFVMYAIQAEFHILPLVLQLVGMLGICALSQAICCLLGWGLHLLLSRMNKSLASLIYMIAFLVIYFSIYSKAGSIINAMAYGGDTIAAAFRNWVWPLYALGRGSLGSVSYLAAFLGVCAVCFGAVYWLLSKTFLRAATSRRSGKKRRLDMAEVRAGSVSRAILHKEWRHFLGSPVYLTNLGLGVIMTFALAAAGVLFRGKLMPVLENLTLQGLDVGAYLPLIICVILGFLISMMFISAPSVSLEGKSLWILKSMPVSSRKILDAKLRFHILLTTPVTVLAGLALALTYGCDGVGTVLCVLVPGLLTLLSGVLGMVCGLKWAKLDWINEAYPCKQSMAAFLTMFGMMGLCIVMAVGFALASAVMSVNLFLALLAVVLAAVVWGLYRVIMTWGATQWEAL